MDLSIIIVNWNVRELLVKCLETIFEFTDGVNYEVIVVDNASNDESVEKIREKFRAELQSERLLVIANKKNEGFSKANNQGLAESRGKYVLFMNPDMEMVENTAEKLKNYLDNNPVVGVVTCSLLYGDQTTQPNVKNDPTLVSQILILLKAHHFFKNLKSLRRYLAKDFDYTQEAEVQQVMGAFMFTRRDLMDQLKAWDEDYWLWWEDVDLCTRVRNAGKVIVYTPMSKVIHYEGKSFEQVPSVSKQKRFIKGVLQYFKKHHSIFAYLTIWLVAPFSMLLALVTKMLKIKPRPQSRV